MKTFEIIGIVLTVAVVIHKAVKEIIKIAK